MGAEPEAYDIVNWEKFQRYTAKRPAWIMAYTALLDKIEYRRLSDALKGHLHGLWLLRARLGEPIPNDQGYVRAMIGANGAIDFAGLVSAGFLKPCTILHDPAQPCKIVALDIENINKSREEDKTLVRENADQSVIGSLHDYFNQQRGGTKPLRLTPERRVKYRARLGTYSVEELKQAIGLALRDPFIRGDNDRHTRYDFPETVLKNDAAVDRWLSRAEPTHRTVDYAKRYAEQQAAEEQARANAATPEQIREALEQARASMNLNGGGV